MSDPYRTSSRYYDAGYSAKSDLVDVDFWVDEARRATGPVLELGCGTGRVLLPAAEAGARIDGVDASPSMLALLRAKLAERPDLAERVELFDGDMRTLSLGRRYALVTIPFRPLQHLYTTEDQLAALRAAAAHLDDGGRLIFDLFDPDPRRLLDGVGESFVDLRWTEGDVEVSRTFEKLGVDKHGQRFWGRFVWHHRRDGELVEERAEDFQMGWYTCREVRLLLRLAGLEVVEEYGDFDRRPLGDGGQMIFVSRRA